MDASKILSRLDINGASTLGGTDYPYYLVRLNASGVLDGSVIPTFGTHVADQTLHLTSAQNTWLDSVAAAITAVEAGYVAGVTSAIQTQIDTKAPSASPTFTGTVVLPSTTSVGTVSSTEIGYLDGVTSALQGQIDLKSPLASPTFTGTPAAPTAAVDTNTTQLATTAYVVGQGYAKLASPTFTGTVVLPSGTSIGSVTNTEISYLSGVTSAIQTQLGLKAPLANPVFTGSVIIPTATPASASATGTAGTITWDASFIYICTATDTWKRVAIATW